MTLLSLILDHLFGRRYWINIVYHVGTRRCEVASFIFSSPEEAHAHKIRLQDNQSFRFIQTRSFRSKEDLIDLTPYV